MTDQIAATPWGDARIYTLAGSYLNIVGQFGQALPLLEKAHELYGDLWLGFKESALQGFLKTAGFHKVEVAAVSREETEPHFETLLASGLKSGR